MAKLDRNPYFICAISSVAALGGLLFGFDTAVISGAIPSLQALFSLDEYALGWAVSSILIGCALGAVVAGKLADRFGRRLTLMACAMLFGVSGVGAGLADTLDAFVFFRLVGGIGVGVAAIVSPLYISETAPAAWRGRLVSLYQLAIVFGILLAYFSNYALLNIADGWRWMFAVQGIPALVFGLCLLAVPETPRWLVGRKRTSSALAILEKTLGHDAARTELALIERSFGASTGASLRDLFDHEYRPVLVMGILIAVFQQVTGINAILYYAPTIFAKTGLDASSSLLQTIALGGVNLVATLGAMALVDTLGRRSLLLSGSAVMGAALAAVALCFRYGYFESYVVLALMLLYVAAFACTLGAVTWVYLSEVFPNRIRATAMSVATLALWLADFAVAYTFPVMNEHLSTATTLASYALFCALAFVYVRAKLPETKGRRLEELEAIFVKGGSA
jgi:MFS transporter, SP family, arabinose:H+ symporter